VAPAPPAAPIALLAFLVLVGLLGLAAATPAAADDAGSEGDGGSPEAPAPDPRQPPEPLGEDVPAGVREAVWLREGRWMVAYDYHRESRAGIRSGTRRQTVADLQATGFSFVPTSADVESHSIEVAVAPHRRITLAARLPLLRVDTKYRAPDGSSFTTREHGVGDLRLSARLRFMRKGSEALNFHFGLGVPTGTIEAEDDTPLGRLPLSYPHRLGAGTVTVAPGATYVGRSGGLRWGVQLGAELSAGKNRDEWAPGHRYHATGWISQRIADVLAASLRLQWTDVRNTRGRDDDLDRDLQPDNDPEAQGGARLDVSPGLTVPVPGLRRSRLALEASWPVYQSLDGPQLERDWALRAGLRWAF